MKISSTTVGRSARNRKLFRMALLSCALGLVPQLNTAAIGQTWVAPTDGSWHDPTNWTGGEVPDDVTANVVIDAVFPPDDLSPSYSVSLDSSVSVASLKLDSGVANLNQSNSTLTVANGIELLQGRYILDQSKIVGGTLKTNGNMFLMNSNTLNGVTLLDALQLRSNGSFGFDTELTLENDTILQSGIVFRSSVILGIDQDLNLTDGNSITTSTFSFGRLDVKDGRTFTIDAGASIDARRLDIYGLGNLINNGLITSSGGPTTLSISIANDSVTNNGTIQAGDQAIIEISSANFHNAITGKVIASDGGRVVIGDQYGSGTWSSEGLIQVADATSTIQLAGQFANADFNTVENKNGGRVEISGVWNNQDGHTFKADQGYVELNGAKVVGGHLTPGANGEFVQVKSAEFDGVQFNGDLNVDGLGNAAYLSNDSKVSGNINISDGASLGLYQDYTVESGRELNLSGSNFNPELYLEEARTLTVAQGGKMQVKEANIYGADYDGGSTLVNEGTIDFKGNNYARDFDLQNRGQITLSESSSVYEHFLGTFDNQSTGDIQVADGAYLDVENLVNTGTIKLQGQDSELWIGDVSSSSLNGIDNTAGGTLGVYGHWDNEGSYTFNSTTGSIYLYGHVVGGSLTPGSAGEFLIVEDGELIGVTVNGGINLAQGSFLALSGNTQINGPLNIGSTLYLDQNLTLRENQVLTFTDPDARVFVNEEFTLTFDPGSVLQGTGTIVSSETVALNGTVTPGFSPGTIEFDSSVIFGAASNLKIELASEFLFDTILVHGDATLGGALDVSLLNGFALQANQNFQFMSIDGLSSGMFAGLSQDGLVGSYNGYNLFIDYQAGDGNDVSLYAVAVPEPASLAALAACGAVYVGWRRRKSLRAVAT